MFQRIKERIKPMIPVYAILPMLLCLLANFIVYSGLGSVAASWKHYDLTTAFDRAVPVMPGFVSVYLGCYVFWIVNYYLILRLGKGYCMRFITGDIFSRIICAAFFLLLPTTNVRPVLNGTDLWSGLLRMVYSVDPAYNLFPSIHCLVSWFCFIGIRGNKNIPKAYRAFSCFFALLVCISTQVTKQHYIVDMAGGILLAELCYYLAFHTSWYKLLEKVCDAVTNFLFHKKETTC